MLDALFSLPFVAEALITWTPLTFYIAAAIIQAIVILVSFKLLQVDPEHNSFIGAGVAVVAIAAAGFLTRDMGLVGILVTGTIIFGMLVAISGGDALKAALVAGFCFGVYAGLGAVVIPKTPLTPDKIGGLPRAILQGGLEEEPIDEEAESDLYKKSEVVDE